MRTLGSNQALELVSGADVIVFSDANARGSAELVMTKNGSTLFCKLALPGNVRS
jgi:hypothetical protein